ncbi:MAG: hypothetical protein CALGDGBN_01636 [Pseudomonadales bacterium]|nr:hypothetical protein [Pseudomonadales bacterium]
MTAAPGKFRIDIDDAVIADLRERLQRARWAADFGNEDWSYGANGASLRALVEYWADGFDWAAQQRDMNRFEHYRVTIDGVPIHYLLKRGVGAAPIPIVLTHGWPWTFWDYRELIEPLADPAAHGGDPADAFDVIVPSLPGFGFSTPLRQTGVNYWKTADLWHELMTGVLGYPKFAAHGGDWGALVTSQLSHKYAKDLYGIHVSMPIWPGVFASERPCDLLGPMLPTLPAELLPQAIAWERGVLCHITVHMLDPQSLAFAMHDSPVGMLAWLLVRLRAWSDCNGDVESRFSRDAILTKATLYWATESFGSSIRFYAEAARRPWQPSHSRTPAFEAPAGISIFRKDPTLLLPESSVANYRLHHLATHESGGHFAAAEEPLALIDDIRATFRSLR